MIVDVFLNKKIQPNVIEVKSWTQMVTFFKEQWEIDKQKEIDDINEEIEDVLENASGIAKKLNVEKMEGHYYPKLIVLGTAFGEWEWISNSIHSIKGCRIMIGWDKSKIGLMVVHMTSQLMLVVIEIIKLKQKYFCSFVYASNSGVERRSLWDELRRIKTVTNGCPLILMGDFKVNLKMEEHFAGGSKVNGDIQDLRE
ncbi:RNA-directed DNA polymerase, eukaryota, reverse transcriptase zinc-binding domain protein [Tanacetum coccineum]